MPLLKNWSVRGSNDPYMAPELRVIYFVGEVYDHPLIEKHPDGKIIRTSSVVEKLGPKTFVTNSGSIYTLEDPHPGYVAFCEEIGKPLNLEDPIKFIQ